MDKTQLRILTIIEIVIAIMVVLLDVLIPTIIVLVMAVFSLLIRREKVQVLGLRKPNSWTSLIGWSFIFAFLLQLFDVGVLMPILNHLTGLRIEYSGFGALQGKVQQMLVLLLIGWSLAAFGEEVVYRGYIQKLFGDLFGKSLWSVILSIWISSLVFGLAHLEQGWIGVVVTIFDAVIFSLLKRKSDDNLWVSIFTHGFYNTIGIFAVFIMGPIYGLW